MWKSVIWKILALTILISLPYAISRLGRVEADYSMSPVTVNITITVTPAAPGMAMAAQNFKATYVTDNVVLLTWDGLPAGAANVTIRVKDNAYSDNFSDGYFLYEGAGNNVTDTNVNFNEYFGYKHYTAYSYNGTDWSPFYSQAKVVSPNVSEIATQITNFNTLLEALISLLASSSLLFFEMFLMLVLITLALWRQEFFIYVVTSLAVFFIAISWMHDYLGISIALVALSLYFLSEAVLGLFGQSWETSILRLFKRKEG